MPTNPAVKAAHNQSFSEIGVAATFAPTLSPLPHRRFGIASVAAGP